MYFIYHTLHMHSLLAQKSHFPAPKNVACESIAVPTTRLSRLKNPTPSADSYAFHLSSCLQYEESLQIVRECASSKPIREFIQPPMAEYFSSQIFGIVLSNEQCILWARCIAARREYSAAYCDPYNGVVFLEHYLRSELLPRSNDAHHTTAQRQTLGSLFSTLTVY